MDKAEIAASLEAVADTKAKLADRMRWPFWRHAASGVMLALMLVATVVDTAYSLILFALVLLPVFAIIEHDKKTHGMFVSGYQRGRTGWVLALMIGLFVAAMIYVGQTLDDPLADPRFWGTAAALLVVSTALSYAWEAVYRADLRSGRA